MRKTMRRGKDRRKFRNDALRTSPKNNALHRGGIRL